MAGFKKYSLYRGGQHLESPSTTICTIADTYYNITGTFSGTLCNGFIRDGLGKLTYKGTSGVSFLLNGTSDLETNSAGIVTYGLFINGFLVSHAETTHTFTSASKTENIAITGFPILNYNDEIEIYVKHSLAGSDVITLQLNTTFLGEI